MLFSNRDADNTVVSFRYRRPDSPGKVYLLKAAAAGGGSAAGSRPTQFVLGERGGTILSADVDLEPLERCSPDFSNSHDFFEVCSCVGVTRGGTGDTEEARAKFKRSMISIVGKSGNK